MDIDSDEELNFDEIYLRMSDLNKPERNKKSRKNWCIKLFEFFFK